MPQPAATCPCTPVGKESFDLETNTLNVSVTFDPGCATCAACTCTPAHMDLSEDDKWKVYVAQNGSCPFCYLDVPDLLLFQPQQDGLLLEEEEEEDDDEPCAVCGIVDDICDCFADNAAGIEQGKRQRLRKLARRLVNKLKALRADKPRGGGGGVGVDGSGSGSGGGFRRALSRKLTAVRFGKSFRAW